MSALARLSLRERILLAVAALAVVFVGGYRLAYLPLEERRAELRAEIVTYRNLTAAARAAPPRDGGGGGAAPLDVPLATRATASAEEAGLTLVRLEPEGTRLRVALEDAPFDTVIGWLAALETRYQTRIAAVEMDRRTAPGTVSARITLEPAG